MFIDNEYKDLTEVRCKDTGKLLGFAPENITDFKPTITVGLRQKYYTKPYLSNQEIATEQKTVKFIRVDSVFKGYPVKTVEIDRIEWIKLIQSERGK